MAVVDKEFLCVKCGSPDTYHKAVNGLRFPLAVTDADGNGYYPMCQQHFDEAEVSGEFKYSGDNNDSVR